MLTVEFYDRVEDNLIGFSVIVSRCEGKWVLCKHKERDTYECPGGHREQGETPEQTARRELWEETGAVEYTLTPICVYSVAGQGREISYGMLYFAEITKLGELPPLEIEKVELFFTLPQSWTYPEIQPPLIEKIKQEVKIS